MQTPFKGWLLVFAALVALPSPARAQGTAAASSPPADDAPVTKMPVVAHFVEAPYPEGAAAKRVEAVVKLEIDIDANGAVEDVRLVAQEGGQGFDFATAAIGAARQFVFEPAEASGVAVPVTITYAYKFALPKIAPRPTGPVPPPATGTSSPAPQAPGEYDILVQDAKKQSDGRVVADPSAAVPNTPRTSGTVVAQTGGRGGGGRGAGGRPGGGRPGGGGGGGGRPPGAGGGGGGRPPGAGGGGGGRGAGRFGGAGSTTGAVQSGNDVVAAVTLANGIVMRGLSPAMTRVVIDGIDVPLAYHLGALRPIVPLGLLDRATFYPGSFPIEYGRADGGLIVLETNRELAQSVTGYADANWADMAALVRAPLTRDLTLSLSGQYSLLDRVLGGVVPDSDVSLAALPRYRDGEIKLLYQPSPTFRASVLGIASSDSLVDWFGDPARGDPAPGTTTFGEDFYRVILSSEWTPSKNVTTRMVLGGGLDETSQTNPAFDVQHVKLQARPSARFRPWKRFAIDVGAEYVVERLDGTVDAAAFPSPTPGLTGTQTLMQSTGRSLAGFLGFDWELFDDFHVIPGARVEHYSQTSETPFDPRALVRWTFVKDRPAIASLGVKGAIGVYHRPPSLLETSAQLGNPALTSESATHYLLGLEYEPVKSVRIGLDGFSVSTSNAIVRSTGTVTRNGAPAPEVFSNGGTGRTRGAELFVDAELGERLEGWLFYTYSVSDLSTDGGTTTLPSPYDQTHVLGTALAYALPDAWKVRTRFQYATGFPMTSVTGGVFDSTNNQYVSVSGPPLGDRAPDFIQLDLRVEKTWTLGARTRLTAYLDVRNVLNRANVVAPYLYDYDYRNRYARTGLPILPMLGIRADF